MKPEKLEISAGIYFTGMPVDKFKTSQLTVYLTLPLTDDSTASKIALLPYVLRRGTRTYPTSAAIIRRQEELYSADLFSGVFKQGDRQVLAFSVNALSREYVPAGEDPMTGVIALLNEVLFDPCIDKTTGVFLDDYVESEKKNACDRIRSIQNNKAAYANVRCLEVMCRDEAYSISERGTAEETAKITPAALFTAYRALLAEARIDIYYTGTAPSEEILALLRPHLDRIHRYPIALPPTFIKKRATKKHQVAERAVASQGKLCIGFRTGVSISDADVPACMLFHSVFAASPTSKLFANVRERLSLCYSCSSRLHLAKGLFVVAAGIENKNKGKAVREVLRQLRKMRAGKITENELNMAVRMMVSQFRSLEDEPTAMERWYLSRDLAGVAVSHEEIAKQIECVTVADLARVAKLVSLDTVYFLRGSAEHTEEEEDFADE